MENMNKQENFPALTEETIVRYLQSHGYPEPERSMIEEFLDAGDKQHIYDECVLNNYDLPDFDRWLHLMKVLGTEIKYETAMKIDGALWEEDKETLELDTPEDVLKKMAEAIPSDEASDFKIEREIDGNRVVIPLTYDEVADAYLQRDHELTVNDVYFMLCRYDVNEKSREAFYARYGVPVSEVKENEQLLDDMARQTDLALCSLDTTRESACIAAIEEVLDTYKKNQDRLVPLDKKIQIAAAKTRETDRQDALVERMQK